MGNKISISTDKCVEGMQVAETIFNDYGAVIVLENTILDRHTIKKLEILDIPRIKIYEMSQASIEKNVNEFKEHYNNQVENIKDIIKDISSGKNLQIDKIDNIVQSVSENIKQNKNVISCIDEVRHADEYTYTHCINVMLLTMIIGKWLKLDQKKINDLAYAGILHDIGKTKVPLEILNKPGKLTDEEYEEIKKHVIYGYRLVENIPQINNDIAMGVLMHHEREDGSGYMLKATGDQIHEYAKIIAIADVYDAMTSNRVYRERQCPFDVFESIQNGNYGKLDLKMTNIFLSSIANYYIGDICRLSTGEEAEITFINPNNIARPLVRLDNVYLDLSKELDIKIIDML